jgi:hypothetical protein
MTMTERAIEELKLAGLYDKDSDYDGEIGKAVEELLKVFSNQGHSGFSAHITIDVFSKIAGGGLLIPLNGTPNEWNEINGIIQNKRYYSVFAKNKLGEEAFDINGIVFKDSNGCCFTCKESTIPVSFPYTPKTKYIVQGTAEAESYKEVFKSF